MSTTMLPSRPFAVLSFDGGGIRGLSSLLILEAIMEGIQKSEVLPILPKPCERFDLIGGTSTGGIIAIMLGRLEMTVDQCIRAYKRLAQTAFAQKHEISLPESSPYAFSAENLENAIKQAIRENCVSPTCREQPSMGIPTANTCEHENLHFYDESSTKTVVLAITKANIEALPTLFKTYAKTTGLSECKIWEVARATSAASTFFEPMKLGRDKIEFIDAGFGHNNPCESLIVEAKGLCQDRQMLVLSLGTGLGDVVEIGETRKSIIEALKKMSLSSKAAELRLMKQYGNTGMYHRFNVENGLGDVTLSDWELASEISAHTNNYLREHEAAIHKFISAMGNIPGVLMQPTKRENGPRTTTKAKECEGHKPVHYIPFDENRHFVGREDFLATLKEKLFAATSFQKVALVGLGGAGKTQVALNLAYWVKKAKPEYSILWLTGANTSGFEDACKTLVEEFEIKERVKEFGIKVSNDKDPKELVNHYLKSEKSGNWFLVVDNVDDIDVFEDPAGNGICDFLPQSAIGRILFTTRSAEVAGLAVNDHSKLIKMDGMSLDESRTILKRSVQGLPGADVQDLLKAIAEELCYLPLAMAQAADYICQRRISPSQYLDLLRSTEADEVQLLKDKHFDQAHHEPSQGAIVIAWVITFKQIEKASQLAARLLEFISQIDAKAIPRTIFPKFKTKEEMTTAIRILTSYGFLRRQKARDLFDMHSLVHLTTKLWFESQGNREEQRSSTLRHIISVLPTYERENRHICRQYLPHARRVFEREKDTSVLASDLAYSMGRLLLRDDTYQESIKLFEFAISTRQGTGSNYFILQCQHELARAYRLNQEHEKAISLPEHVAIREKTVAVDDPDCLSSKHALAAAYLDDKQVKKAIPLLEHVVATREKTLAANHPDRLSSQHVLARAYLDDNQVKKAILLIEYVVATREKILAVHHVNRLASQHVLATAYLRDNQVKKAIPLLEHVIATEEKTLAVDNPSRLSSQHALAGAYLDDNQVEKAILLIEYVVATREKILAVHHVNRLASQHVLARAYLHDNQVEKAIPLLEHVVAIREKTVAVDDPSRLSSQHVLARAYLRDNQVKKAILLLEHVVVTREKTLGADDSNFLASQNVLAGAYLRDNQVKKAIPLLERVVAAQEKTLVVDHPSLRSSQQLLARTYLANGQG
ncbi:pyruvate kinase [Ceratocystis lukuohia]|uniref:Pyruvate kinase n=1 Tax=Ceratocystis lukuohia TaxID=2019550 RepID=A0ABR4MGK8_9PEZI